MGFERSALDLVSLGVIVLELADIEDANSFRILYLNNVARTAAGLMASVDVAGQSIDALGMLLQSPDSRRALVRAIADEESQSLKNYHKTSPEGTCRLSGVPIGQMRVMVNCQDITGDLQTISDMQRSNDELRFVQDHLDQIYRTSPVGMCLIDKEMRYIKVNQPVADLNNTPIEQHIGKTMVEIIPDLAPYIEPTLRQVLKMGEAITNVEVQKTTPQDSMTPRYWIVCYHPFLDENGDSRGVSVTIQEITQFKREQRTIEESFLQGLLGGQERERSRLAREIHEGAAQTVMELAMRLTALRDKCAEPLKENVAGLASLANSTAESLRRMALALHPLIIEDLGLIPALRQHIAALNEHSAAALTLLVEAAGTEQLLPEEIALTTYRVCQESLANALKHARPKHVDVRVTIGPHLLTLQVDDDGVGFDPTQITEDVAQLGIASMRERAHLINGSLHLETRVGGGTSVRLQIPLP